MNVRKPEMAGEKNKIMKRMKFVFKGYEKGYEYDYPFLPDEIVLFLGEIEEMPGHCVVAKRDGRVMWGYHTLNFEELSEDQK